MKIKNRIFDYDEKTIQSGLKAFIDGQSKNNVFRHEVLNGASTDAKGNQVPNTIEIVKCIEDFARIIENNGFDVETGKYLSVRDLSERMDDFVRSGDGDGDMRLITKDFSLNSLGFVITQTITRLVARMEQPEIDAWMYVTKDLIMPEGSVFYQVIVGNTAHATARIAEGGQYNSLKLESTEDAIKTSGWKVGVKVSYSEEAQRRAGLLAIKMLTEAALNDIKRFKAVEAMHLLEANARTYFDALDTGHPELMPSGVSYKDPKKKNGTLLMRDMRDFFGATQNMGFDVDYIFINPLSYDIFLYEPSVKEYFEKNANVKFLLPKKRQTIAHNIMTKMSKVVSNTDKVKEGNEVIAPNLIQNKTFTIIVTPLVKFHKKGEPIYTPKTRYEAAPVVQHEAAPNDCSDVLLVDSSRALTHVHNNEGITSDTITNRLLDTTDIKFKTYYSFVVDKDHGIFAFRNINITSDIFDPEQKVVVTLPHSDLYPRD